MVASKVFKMSDYVFDKHDRNGARIKVSRNITIPIDKDFGDYLYSAHQAFYNGTKSQVMKAAQEAAVKLRINYKARVAYFNKNDMDIAVIYCCDKDERTLTWHNGEACISDAMNGVFRACPPRMKKPRSDVIYSRSVASKMRKTTASKNKRSR